MKKTVIAAIFMLIATSTLVAQQTIRSESLMTFKTVSANGKLDVKLIKAETAGVEIILDNEADIAKFKWAVNNEELSFVLKGNKGRGEVIISYVDTLRTIKIHGGTLLTAEPVVGSMLSVSASGGAKITMEVDVLDLELDISGNSAATFVGEAKYLAVRATDKSVVDSRDVYALSVDAESSSGAEIYLNVEERLVANARSSSTIFYRGRPVVFKDITSRMSSGMMGSSVLNIGE